MKTSLISGTFVIARKQWSMMGWPATSKSGCASQLYGGLDSERFGGVPWGRREKAAGSVFLWTDHQPVACQL